MSFALNEPQALAVQHSQGPLLVFAGAGSGKTRVITFRVANLIAEHRVPPYRILTVTFTNKAAGELKHRLCQLAGESVTGDLWVGTFHSVCARLLRRYHADAGLEKSFSIYDDSDQKAVMARVLKAMGVDDRQLPPKAALQRIHAEKKEGRMPPDVENVGINGIWLRDVYSRYQDALLASNAVDFDDLLIYVMRIVETADSAAGKELRQRFSYVLVDEFQDTNLVQFRIVRALCAETRNLCVVGDDDQSIYSWRGADVRLIRGFRKDFPDATVIKLEQNYRSTGNIVAAALGVIAPAKEREPKKLWTSEEDGDPVTVRQLRDEREEAAWVVKSLREAMGQGIRADQMAVFYRIHAQSRVLEEALRGENVPYQVIGGQRFFERAEIKDLIAYLRLLDNPRSNADLERIINVPARGIGDKTLERLFDMAAARGTSLYDAILPTVKEGGLGAAARGKLTTFFEIMEELRRGVSELGPRRVAEMVVSQTGYRAQLKKDDTPESDARLENIEEFLGAIGEYEEDAGQAGEEPSLSGYLERITLASAVDSMKDAPRVSLMTVHAAKGLEFELVALTGMEEEVFPYRSSRDHAEEDPDEERRLAYVAITRARRRLLITHTGTRTLFGNTRWMEPSRFLDDLPEECVVRETTMQRSSPSPSSPPTAFAPPRSLAWGGGYRSAGGSGAKVSSGKGTGSSGLGTKGVIDRGPAVALSAELPETKVPAPGERFVDKEFFDDPPSSDGDVEVRRGDRVTHQRFGEGVVEQVETGKEPTIVARFPGFGVRRVLARFLAPA